MKTVLVNSIINLVGVFMVMFAVHVPGRKYLKASDSNDRWADFGWWFAYAATVYAGANLWRLHG